MNLPFPTPGIVSALCPNGRLRASINLGNPVLAGRDSGTGQPKGISVDLARALAELLDVELELITFDSAGKSVDAVTQDRADIGFFAVDPLRGAGISFSAPYVLIEGAYLVRAESPLQRNDEVDVEGRRIVVGLGSAYDLFLTREITRASLVRAPTSPAVVDTFLDGGHDVAAGVRQQLESDAARLSGLRLLPGRFMVIGQAMGTPKGRGETAAEFLRAYVEAQKSAGFVTEAMARHAIEGASVAPPA